MPNAPQDGLFGEQSLLYVGSSLQIEPKCFGASNMLAPAGNDTSTINMQHNTLFRQSLIDKHFQLVDTSLYSPHIADTEAYDDR